jgi:hypothetical protein
MAIDHERVFRDEVRLGNRARSSLDENGMRYVAAAASACRG